VEDIVDSVEECLGSLADEPPSNFLLLLRLAIRTVKIWNPLIRRNRLLNPAVKTLNQTGKKVKKIKNIKTNWT